MFDKIIKKFFDEIVEYAKTKTNLEKEKKTIVLENRQIKNIILKPNIKGIEKNNIKSYFVGLDSLYSNLKVVDETIYDKRKASLQSQNFYQI